jgi:hypothetical protein
MGRSLKVNFKIIKSTGMDTISLKMEKCTVAVHGRTKPTTKIKHLPIIL